MQGQQGQPTPTPGHTPSHQAQGPQGGQTQGQGQGMQVTPQMQAQMQKLVETQTRGAINRTPRMPAAAIPGAGAGGGPVAGPSQVQTPGMGPNVGGGMNVNVNVQGPMMGGQVRMGDLGGPPGQKEWRGMLKWSGTDPGTNVRKDVMAVVGFKQVDGKLDA